MVTPESLTVIAYYADEERCSIVCRNCGERGRLPTGLSLNWLDLTHSDDWPEGLYCDDCGKEIIIRRERR